MATSEANTENTDKDFAISTPEQLAELIEGRSDKEIEETIVSLGVDNALDKVFEGFTREFQADKAKENAIVQWNIATPQGVRSYHLTIRDGKCDTARGAADARTTLTIGVADFLRMITGRLNTMQAFFQGKLKVTGDVLFAQNMQTYFRLIGSA